MGSSLFSPIHVVLILFLVVIPGVPAFVAARRRGVSYSGVAFIPFVGPWITLLRSANLSGWLTILTVVPVVNIVFGLYAAFTIPSRHSRNTVWGVWFIIPLLNVLGFWVYAFTLKGTERALAALT